VKITIITGTDPPVSTTYTTIKALSFSLETDVTGSSLPINGFSVEIYTTDSIDIGSTVQLYDDLDQLWAEYECVRAEVAPGGWMRIQARCWLWRAEEYIVGAEVFDGATVGDLMDEYGTQMNKIIGVDTALEDIELNGYLPDQNLRERLIAIAFAAGGYFKSWGGTVELLKIDDTATVIPLEDTYIRPQVKRLDPVGYVMVNAWDVAEGTPQQGDKSVEVDGHTYILTPTYMELTQTVPFIFESNGTSVKDLAIINADNADDVLSHMAKYYFPSVDCECDVINNHAYFPGDKVTVSLGEEGAVTGYIERCDFAFGVQAKARLKLTACAEGPLATLTIVYQWEGAELARQTYSFPVGYAYSVRTRALDVTTNSHRYVFYPRTGSVAGTMTAQGITATVVCDVALDLYKGTLEILIVDEVSVVEETVDGESVLVGVIT
jgi:hypothetical protein